MKGIKLLQIGAVMAWAMAATDTHAEGLLGTGSLSDHKGSTGGAGSYAPKFSADGRYVVFVSHANNLVTNDDRRPFLDVFRRDLILGETVLVSVNASSRGGGDEDSSYPDISADGRYVTFVSAAGNLVSNDTNGPSTGLGAGTRASQQTAAKWFSTAWPRT
jgi:Tol biopolymer transport system component